MLDESSLLGKVVTFAILGLLGWLAITTYNLSIQQAVIGTELQGVKDLIVQMQTNYITKSEAEVRFSILQGTLDRYNDRLRVLEGDNALE